MEEFGACQPLKNKLNEMLIAQELEEIVQETQTFFFPPQHGASKVVYHVWD